MNITSDRDSNQEPGYLIWTPQCKIIDLDPFAPDIMEYFTKENYTPCSDLEPLTSIEQNFRENTAKLVLHFDRKSQFLSLNQTKLNCSYQEVQRLKGDFSIKLSSCHLFEDSFMLSTSVESIIVKCNAIDDKKDQNYLRQWPRID